MKGTDAIRIVFTAGFMSFQFGLWQENIYAGMFAFMVFVVITALIRWILNETEEFTEITGSEK